MRIISSFNDYYDGVQALGQDQALIYQRKTLDIEDWKPDTREYDIDTRGWFWDRAIDVLRDSLRFNNGVTVNLYTGCVGFCGKLYPFFEIRAYYLNSNKKVESTIVYDVEHFISCIAQYTKHSELDVHDIMTTKNIRFSSMKVIDRVATVFARKDNKAWSKSFDAVFRQHNTPAFLYSSKLNKYVLQLHPNLSKLGFQKIKDPYTAFQELEMYISGVLGVGEPVTVQIDDIHMRDAKGFDDRSFKTESPGKKRKRKKK